MLNVNNGRQYGCRGIERYLPSLDIYNPVTLILP